MAELLAPAGNVEALDAAIGEGADAVYMGLKSFNARLRSSNFAWNQFEAAVQSVHRQNKKIFVTVNTVSEEREMERLYRFLCYLDKIGPDGIIVQDLGVVRMVQEFFPNIKLHASTQMNIASARGVNLLSKQGFKRVVLSRELGLSEIKEIKQNTSAELEVFVHGALCVSESGLCLFSSYLGGKSANRGMCTQACRRCYQAESSSDISQGYFFSPYDLQLIEYIPDLINCGVDSFKIEGRMKSAEYVGSVTSAYRYVMDHYIEDRKGAIATGKRLLSTDFARSKTKYWYIKKNTEDFDAKTLLNPNQAGGTGIYLGHIERTQKIDNTNDLLEDDEDFQPDEKINTSVNEIKKDEKSSEIPSIFALLKGGNYDPEVGDSIRLHKKDDTGRVSHKIKSIYEDGNDRWIDIPKGYTKGDEVYLLQTKSMSKRYPRVLPGDLSKFRSQPGAQELPILDLSPLNKNSLSYFPDGFYVQVSTVTDLYTIQSENPIRVILELNSETKQDIVEKRQVIPFSKKQIFISLDPYCPRDIEEELASTIDYLVDQGYNYWIVNNPAHISMLKDKKATMIAGPYLYTFNRWAFSWLENQGIECCISPYENSRQNIEATYERNQRKRVLVPLFSYPALFRMRFKLPETYDFLYFNDKGGETFKILSTPDGSFVLPENPFSIVDKTQFLKNSGFSHFLIDLSKTRVKKSDFKQIMKAVYKNELLSETTRFNWKDGFYSPEKMEEYKNANERYQEQKRLAYLKSQQTGQRTGKRTGNAPQEKPYNKPFAKNSRRTKH